MIINVKVKPNSKTNKIELKNNRYIVRLTEKAKKGKANRQLVAILADYFNVAKSKINIKKGLTKKNKVIEITDAKCIIKTMKNKEKSINYKDKKKSYLSRIHCWKR